MLKRYELRCFCSRSPLLAVYGVDDEGRLFIHVRAYKRDRIYAETITYGGEMKLRCRECRRWQKVVFVSPDRASLKEDFVSDDLITDEP